MHDNDFSNLFFWYSLWRTKICLRPVLPQLKCCSQIWSPFKKKSTSEIGKIQNIFATNLRYKNHILLKPTLSRCLHIKEDSGCSISRDLITDLLRNVVLVSKIWRLEVRSRARTYWVFRPTSERRSRFVVQQVSYAKALRWELKMLLSWKLPGYYDAFSPSHSPSSVIHRNSFIASVTTIEWWRNLRRGTGEISFIPASFLLPVLL